MRARFPLAIALFEQHKNAEARHELETVRREAGERPSICYYFGRLDLEEQNYKSAVANWNKAIAKPPFPDTAYCPGFAYLKEGNEQDAEKWLKEATKRNPDDSRAEYQLALLHKKEGREEEAKQAFSRTKEQRDASNKLSQLKWDCAHELDRGVTEQAITVCEQSRFTRAQAERIWLMPSNRSWINWLNARKTSTKRPNFCVFSAVLWPRNRLHTKIGCHACEKSLEEYLAASASIP